MANRVTSSVAKMAVIEEKVRAMEKSLDNIDITQEKILDRIDTYTRAVENRINVIQVSVTRNETNIKNLDGRARIWDISNTIGIIIASILGALGIKNQ